jgi:hypothetical protein
MILGRRALQICVLLASLVPISAGLAGAITGSLFLADQAAPALHDSHDRYLSGLLLAIGLAFASAAPRIEKHTSRFRLLGAIVFIGGLARLLGVVLTGAAPAGVWFALVMELVVTPGLAIWQGKLAKQTSAERS